VAMMPVMPDVRNERRVVLFLEIMLGLEKLRDYRGVTALFNLRQARIEASRFSRGSPFKA
jgi:hypothetical protein